MLRWLVWTEISIVMKKLNILIFPGLKLAKSILAEFFIGYFLFVFNLFHFLWQKMMALDSYFKKKAVLTDPNGDLSLTTHPW